MDESDPLSVPAEPEPHLTPAEPSRTATVAPRPSQIKLALLLAALSLVGCVAVLPFTYTLLKSADTLKNLPAERLPLVLGASVVIEFLLSVAAIALGMRFGPGLGLIPPLLHPALTNIESNGAPADAPGPKVGWRWRVVGLSLCTGAMLGFAIVVAAHFANPHLPKPPAPPPRAGPIAGFLASIGAGIREEVWMRLGALTVLASFGASLSRTRQLGPVSFWTANLIAASLFAAIHIPQAFTLIGMNAALLAVILIGNGVPGLVFGWLYRRYGLVSAMLSHFMIDVVLKVILPALDLD
jgi:membrane protease YdiL (CAAX protease family)